MNYEEYEQPQPGYDELSQLDEEGNYAKRVLPDGRTLYVFPLSFGRARLGVGNKYIPYSFDNSY